MRFPNHLPLPAVLLVAMMLPFWAAVVYGQSPDISLDHSHRDGISSLHLPWRYNAADAPEFASPELDDSGWPRLERRLLLPSRRSDLSHLWVRVRIRNDANDLPLAVLLDTKGSVPYQVYANGTLIAESPGIANGHLQRPRPFAIALPASPNILLAIRFVSTGFYRIAFMPLLSLDIGGPAAIAQAAELRRIHEFDDQFTAQILGVALCIALGLFAVVLFLAQPARTEYRWLALFGLMQGMYIAFRILVTSGILPVTTIELLLYRYAGGMAMICLLEFLLYLAQVKGRRLARLLQAVTLLGPFIGIFSEHLFELTLIVILLAIAIYIVGLLVRAWRLDVTESKLLVPAFSLLILTTCLYFLSQVFPGRVWYPPVIHLGTVGISADDLDVWFLLVSLVAVMLFRFIRVSHDEQRSSAELDAARNIQNILIPEQLPSVPGFIIDSIYQPAQQVGGDFFQIIPLPGEAGTLIALGDVSGKGLPAAMTVAVIVGALRTAAEYTHSPVALMDILNRRLYSRGTGFTTCIVLLLTPSGEAIIASAGHLEPYFGGRALALEPSLPLGLSTDVLYTETSVLLQPGESLMLLTDGVVEAIHPQTRELFGFERTLAISASSAREIAAAAHRFSAPAPQSDDITVLTIVHA